MLLRKFNPQICLDHIFGYAVAIGVTHAKTTLGFGISLRGSFTIPFDGFHVILKDSIAAFVTTGKKKLCLGIALFSGLAIPFRGF